MGFSWWINTGIEVDVAAWNKAQKSTSAQDKYFSSDKGKEVLALTTEVDDVIKRLFLNKVVTSSADKSKLEQAISDVVNVKGIKAQKEAEDYAKAEQQRRHEEERNRLCVVANYYEDFMERISNGELRQGKDNSKYRKSSLSVWKTFGKHLTGYLEHKHRSNMTFDDINKSFADGFTNYLESKGLMLGTINQQVNCFRRLCSAAAEDEKNKNLISLKVWHSHEEKDADKRAGIVLSESEIDKLYEMKLDGLREQVRDMWCLGYFCAQRVSDYSRLTRDNFSQTRGGLDVIVLQQQKTGKELVIPILDDRVFEICEKYDYKFPMLTRDTQNRFIKIVSKELSETVPSLKEWSRTLLTLRERQKEESYLSMKKRIEDGEKLHGEESKRYRRMAQYATEHESGDLLYKRDSSGEIIRQRWELITCHTSRRSQVTNMFDSGIYDVKDIMSVSGHSTIRNFERYLKRDAVSQAESLAEKARKAKEVKMKKEA
jgi:integrase